MNVCDRRWTCFFREHAICYKCWTQVANFRNGDIAPRIFAFPNAAIHSSYSKTVCFRETCMFMSYHRRAFASFGDNIGVWLVVLGATRPFRAALVGPSSYAKLSKSVFLTVQAPVKGKTEADFSLTNHRASFMRQVWMYARHSLVQGSQEKGHFHATNGCMRQSYVADIRHFDLPVISGL